MLDLNVSALTTSRSSLSPSSLPQGSPTGETKHSPSLTFRILQYTTGMQASPPYPMTDIERALEHGDRIRPFRGLLFIFWGILLAKCLFLQWAIFTYEVPIDGWLFVWTPSFLFRLLCMFVYARSALGDFSRAPLTNRLTRGVWLACGAAFLIFLGESLALGGISPLLLPAIFAVLIGVGFFIEGMAEGTSFYEILGAAWWLGAGLLFFKPGTNSLAVLGALLLLLQVLPATVVLIQQRRASKASTYHV